MTGGKIGIVAIALVSVLGCLPALAGKPGASAAEGGLDEFKQLIGTWEGTNQNGDAVTLRYELVGDGTAVLEHLDIRGHENHHNMVTMYHLDNDRLMLTHYCAAGNQPWMRAESIRPGEVRFDFVDATSLASLDDGHMYRAVYKFTGKDSFTSEWTYRENGSDAFTAVVNAVRVSRSASR